MPPETYYPPGAFYFELAMVGQETPAGPWTEIDASFQEVSGIQAELNTEEVVEGGENRFVHRLPRAAKYPNLVLKRGAVVRGSTLAEWVEETLLSNLTTPIAPQELLVMLLNDQGEPLMSWGFSNAYPLKWDYSSLSSMENKILTETLEFSYSYSVRL